MTISPPAPDVQLRGPSAVELPIHLTRFVGRDAELNELARLLSGTRLLTLTGAGGSGKTRLAREWHWRAGYLARPKWKFDGERTTNARLARHLHRTAMQRDDLFDDI